MYKYIEFHEHVHTQHMYIIPYMHMFISPSACTCIKSTFGCINMCHMTFQTHTLPEKVIFSDEMSRLRWYTNPRHSSYRPHQCSATEL